jgi:2-polyprenyl-6-methoxyphenol hydroxylase-like FAD-dependent oxidoreductase
VRSVAGALLALILAIQPRQGRAAEPYDVVVVGGGPTGHAAVLEVLRSGARRVLLLESRSEQRTRDQVLALEGALARRLTEYGLDVRDRERFTPVRQTGMTLLDEVAPIEIRNSIRGPERLKRAAEGHALGSATGMVLTRIGAPVATSPISTLEDALHDRVRADPRVTTRFNANVETVEQGQSAAVVRYVHDGATSSVRARLVGLAVGSGSPLLDKLGIGRRVVGTPSQPVLQGQFDEPGDAVTVHRARVKDLHLPPDITLDGDLPVRGVLVGWAGKEGRTGLGMEVPRGATLSPAQERAYLEAAAKLVGIRGKLLHYTRFDPRLTRSERVFAGPNIALLGDALQTTVPQVGLGANTSVMQGRAFGTLYRGLTAAKGSIGEAVARLRYTANVRTTAAALHLHSKLFMNYVLPLPSPRGGRAHGVRLLRAVGVL